MRESKINGNEVMNFDFDDVNKQMKKKNNSKKKKRKCENTNIPIDKQTKYSLIYT